MAVLLKRHPICSKDFKKVLELLHLSAAARTRGPLLLHVDVLEVQIPLYRSERG